MIKVSRAIAANTDLITAQSFVYPHKLESGETEYLFLIISASAEDIFIKVRQKGLQIEEWFFESANPLTDKFSEGTKTLIDHLKDSQNLEFVLGFLKADNELYLQFYGEPRVLLDRQGQLLDLLESFSENQLIHGKLLEGDKVLVATSQSEDQDKRLEGKFIKQLLTNDGESLEDEIEMYYQKNNLLDPIAVVLIDYPLTSEFSNLNRSEEGTNPKISLKLPFLNLKSRKAQISLALLLGVIISSLVLNIFRQRQLDSQKQLVKNISQEQNAPSSNNYAVTEWPVFLSLELIKSGFTPKKSSDSLGKLLLFDESQQSLILLDLSKKTNRILAGSTQLGTVRDVGLNGDDAFAYSEEKGVSKIDLNTNKITVIVKPDPEWGYIKSIYAFAGNIYLLDSIKNQIWKYVPIQTGYSDKFTYLAEGVTADFVGSKQMEIDSSIWVLKQGPEILKFTSGNKDFFSPGGLDMPLKEIAYIYVSEKEDRAYLLDSENSRLVVLKKNGEYVAQYTGDKFKTVSNLVVDDASKKIFLIEGSKLYQLDLR